MYEKTIPSVSGTVDVRRVVSHWAALNDIALIETTMQPHLEIRGKKIYLSSARVTFWGLVLWILIGMGILVVEVVILAMTSALPVASNPTMGLINLLILIGTPIFYVVRQLQRSKPSTAIIAIAALPSPISDQTNTIRIVSSLNGDGVKVTLNNLVNMLL